MLKKHQRELSQRGGACHRQTQAAVAHSVHIACASGEHIAPKHELRLLFSRAAQKFQEIPVLSAEIESFPLAGIP